MSRLVLRDRELEEALTVVEIPESVLREAARGGPRVWRFAVPPSLPCLTHEDYLMDLQLCLQTVDVRLEPVMTYKDGKRKVLYWTGYPTDPTLALLLRSVFLPGQVGEAQRRERLAYVSGLFGLPPP